MSERAWWWCGGWLVAAGWAGVFPLVSGLGPHRMWGACAALGYGAAALAAVVVRRRGREVSVAVALVGSVLVPLLALVLTGRGQSEVGVIERSGVLLLHTGTPYLAEPRTVDEYNPYLPGMALLGLPRAVLGASPFGSSPFGDARLWCALVFLLCALRTVPAGRRLGGHALGGYTLGRHALGGYALGGHALGGYALGRHALGAYTLTASPVVALPLCVSGVDLPLTGLCWLALVRAGERRPVAAGLALAAACSLKWTAWPAVAVVAALLAATAGRRAALRGAAVAVGGAALLVLPGALRSPGPLVRQVFAFPTGRGDLPTPAASPLPGQLLAGFGPPGWYAAVGLLLLAGLAVGASLLLRPPLNTAGAAHRLALGLTAAFLLAPAGRFGYLALPLVLVLLASTSVRKGLPWAPPSSSPTTTRPARAASRPSSTPWPPACPGRSWSTPPPSPARPATTQASPSR
ncbi:glycosyltransferase 87 family protein [Kitasatospora sp. SUK 42]|uniref:glycosyltransferase 87 family protein n=1 Tax=Kitasatospora sp. SUK 42 TaxID=1588882 RepID=UPI0027E257BC|nr:glycosyltransferase 87 family protein [Kitasatospora sp. SUK 42]